MNIKKQPLVLWGFPLFVLLIQFLPFLWVFGAGVLALIVAVSMPKIRSFFLLLGFTAFGHGIWLMLLPLFKTLPYGGTLQRFGLGGYLVIFLVWGLRVPTENNYLQPGDLKSIIKIPGVWKGHPEPVWRFTLIFSGLCAAASVVLWLKNPPAAGVIWAGLLFTLINATLEEILWRGLILPRANALPGVTPLYGLIGASLAFGFYHISLGFSLPMCLLFAVGGFYMGAATLVSKGLVSTWIMHIMVNLLMVFMGLLPY